MSKEELIQEIIDFVNEYANISPNWDQTEDSDKYTGPDPYQLLGAVESLKRDEIPTRVWSEWGSGCYGRYSDKAGREKHDNILLKLKEYEKNN